MTPLTQLRACLRTLLLIVLTVSCCSAQTGNDLYGQQLQDLVRRVASGSPAAKVAVLDRMAALREYENDADTVAKAINRVAENRSEATLVRDTANWHRAAIALHERRLADTSAMIESLGFVRDWTLVGAHSCKPKSMAQGTPLKSSPLAVMSVYDEPSAICAAAAVYSGSPKNVALRFGANGPVSVYANDVLMASAGDVNRLGFDQHSVGVQLHEGWNTVALELGGKSASKQFALRITGVDGGGIALAADASRVSGAAVPHVKVAVLDLIGQAEQQAAKSKSAEAFEALGTLENDRGLATAAEHLQMAARMAPTPERWLAAARACASPSCSLAAINRALLADPQSLAAKTALADYFSSANQWDKALAILKEIVARVPYDFTARKRLADAYSATGETTAAFEEYRKLEASGSNSIWLRRELALRYEAAGFAGRANSLLHQVWKSNFDDVRVRAALQRLATRRGDTVALEMLAQAANIADPSDPVAQLEIAKYASSIRDLAKSPIVISDTDVSNNHLGEGRPTVALDSATLRGQLIKVAAHDEGDATSAPRAPFSYFENAAKLAADAQRSAPPESANIVVLADVTMEQMQANGQSTIQAQQVFYVANDRGARDYSTRTVQFSSANQRLTMIRGRIYKADGRIVEADDEGENTVTDNSSSMYFDTRSRMLRFPGLEKGDVMELEYRCSPNSNTNPYGNYFGALITFQSGLPQHLRRYVLAAPTSRRLNIAEQRMPVKAAISEVGDQTIYRWDATDLKPLMSEPRGPAHTEIAPYVSISTFEDWDQLGRWYADMITPQLALDSDLREVLARITADAKTEQEEIQAVYEFVLRNTNYVAMEFGIYSYKPYPVTQVYARRFGDCKDKASLMIAMLHAVGIDAELALVRTRKLGDVSDHATTLAIFNHALAYVPKYNMWLDGTAEYAGSRELPLDDQGAMAVTVNLNGSATLRRVPVTLPMQNYTHRMVQAKVQPDGKIVFSGSAYTRGEDAPGLRREYELAERQKDTVRGNLAQVYPSVRVESVHVEGAHDIERDVNVKFSGSLDTFAGHKTLSLVPSWLPHQYVNSLAALESRSQQLQLPAPWTTEEELHFTVPDGARFEELPKNLQYDTPFGTAMIRYERHGRELTIATSVQFRKLRIEPSEYAAFRDFCSQVEKAFHQEIKIRLNG